MDPITLVILGAGALGLGYWAFVKKGLSGVPTVSGTASKAAPLVTPASTNPASPLTPLQQMVNAIPADSNSGAWVNQMAEILKYMKQNQSSHALIPAVAAKYLVSHGVDAARTGQ